MLPRWFRAVVLVEVVGVIVLGVLLVRLATAGVHAAGDVIAWARPHLGIDAPHAQPIAPPAPPTPPGAGAANAIGPAFLQHLDQDTGRTASGELAIIEQIEQLIRERVERLLAGAGRR